MDELRKAATASVARACGFGGLAISCTMIGFAHDFVRALQAGGVLLLVMALILSWRGYTAPGRPYKTTEAWLMLDPAKRPAADQAQWAFGTVLREVYLHFAWLTAILAMVVLLSALAFATLRWLA